MGTIVLMALIAFMPAVLGEIQLEPLPDRDGHAGTNGWHGDIPIIPSYDPRLDPDIDPFIGPPFPW